jgi:hypothetical protein
MTGDQEPAAGEHMGRQPAHSTGIRAVERSSDGKVRGCSGATHPSLTPILVYPIKPVTTTFNYDTGSVTINEQGGSREVERL